MSYFRYRGVRIVDGKKKYGSWHTSYYGMQTGLQGAYRELKSKANGWEYLIIEHYLDRANVTFYYIAFVDREGLFGKKNGVIIVRSRDAKGSLSKATILGYGKYVDSNGLDYDVKDVMKKKKKTLEFGMPDNWHPFGL